VIEMKQIEKLSKLNLSVCIFFISKSYKCQALPVDHQADGRGPPVSVDHRLRNAAVMYIVQCLLTCPTLIHSISRMMPK